MEVAFVTLLIKDVLIGDRWSKSLKGRYCMGSFFSAVAKGCNYLVLGLEKKAVIKAREEAQDWQTYDTCMNYCRIVACISFLLGK